MKLVSQYMFSTGKLNWKIALPSDWKWNFRAFNLQIFHRMPAGINGLFVVVCIFVEFHRIRSLHFLILFRCLSKKFELMAKFARCLHILKQFTHSIREKFLFTALGTFRWLFCFTCLLFGCSFAVIEKISTIFCRFTFSIETYSHSKMVIIQFFFFIWLYFCLMKKNTCKIRSIKNFHFEKKQKEKK